MPVMGGVELARSLRIVEKDLRFVVLSGSVTKERLAELEGLGIKSVLSKPCEAAKFLQAMHRGAGGMRVGWEKPEVALI